MTTITIERAVVHRALSALEYHTQQTRPIHNTELVIEELRDTLAAPATAPDSQEVKQIAEALRRIGMTLIRTGTGFKVMALGTITAQEDKP